MYNYTTYGTTRGTYTTTYVQVSYVNCQYFVALSAKNEAYVTDANRISFCGHVQYTVSSGPQNSIFSLSSE